MSERNNAKTSKQKNYRNPEEGANGDIRILINKSRRVQNLDKARIIFLSKDHTIVDTVIFNKLETSLLKLSILVSEKD